MHARTRQQGHGKRLSLERLQGSGCQVRLALRHKAKPVAIAPPQSRTEFDQRTITAQPRSPAPIKGKLQSSLTRNWDRSRENVIPVGHRFAQPPELGWFPTGGKGKKWGQKDGE